MKPGGLRQRRRSGLGGRGVFGRRLVAARRFDEGVPIPDIGDIAGMAGAEEEQARDEAARLREAREQVRPGDQIRRAGRLGEFEHVPEAVAAPMHDVIAAALPDLRLEPLARDAMGEEIGDDATMRIDFLFEQLAQRPPFPPRGQRRRPARGAEHKQHAQRLVLAEFERCETGSAVS